MILGTQVRAARALLGWTVRDLAHSAAVSLSAVNSLEGGAGPPAISAKKRVAIQSVLEAAGIEFLDGNAPSASASCRYRTALVVVCSNFVADRCLCQGDEFFRPLTILFRSVQMVDISSPPGPQAQLTRH